MITQLIISGLVLGGIYSLLSLGLSLILGVSKFVNFAYGDIVMIGTYMGYIFYSNWGLLPYYSWPVVVLSSIIFGLILFLIIRGTIGKEGDSQILITLALSMILQNFILLIFKSDYKGIPSRFTAGGIKIGNAFVSPESLIIFVLAIVITILFMFFIHKTNLGRAMRAVGNDRITSKLMGINVNKIDLMVFLIGTIMACFAGTLLIGIYPTTPSIGSIYNLLAWIMIVLGGVGQLYGAIISGFIIGLVEVISGFYFGADLRQLFYFVIFVIVLTIRPEGLFANFTLRKVKK